MHRSVDDAKNPFDWECMEVMILFLSHFSVLMKRSNELKTHISYNCFSFLLTEGCVVISSAAAHSFLD